MDRNKAIRRSLTTAGRIVVCAASVFHASASPASTQLDQRNELVNTYITTMHADPLVADCAAHGNFVASTSSVVDHVEFSPQSFDSAHATVTPWNDSFDEGKQRVKVDTIVSVEGTGISQHSGDPPFDLKFRCGYVDNQMLAFSWNDPVPPARARSSEGAPSATGNASVRGKQAGSAKGKSKGKAKPATSRNRKKATSGKSAHKPSASTPSKTRSHATKTVARKSTKKTAATPAKKKSSK